MNDIGWVKGAVIYQIFPDRFARARAPGIDGRFEAWDAPETPDGFKGGNLKGAEERLDHIKDLGATAIYLNPIFASAANHRYHTYDYYRVDPVLGGDEAFASFLKAAHRRGIRVILDGVFNHASRGFFQFNHLLENGAASPYRGWFHPHGFPLRAYGLAPGEKPNYSCWWNLPALPKFNTANPEVRRFILGAAKYWLEKGIDGWRLDVPHEIDDDSFWREFRRTCKAVNPGCYIVGEIWGEAKRWLAGDQFDAVMNYQLSAACISYFGGKKLKLNQPYDGRWLKPCGQKKFISDINALLALYPRAVTLAQMNMLSSHDTDRLLDTYGGDATRVRMAVVFSFLFPGAVNVYYGEEIGMRGVLNRGTRGAMPWKKKSSWDLGLLKLHRELAALRRSSPELREGGFEFIGELCDGELLAFRRRLGSGSVEAFLNNGAAPREVPLGRGPGGRKLRLAGPGAGLAPRGGALALRLPPGGYAVL